MSTNQPSSQDYVQIGPGAWDATKGQQINFALKRIFQRLNQAEGRQGSPTIYSNLSMNGNRILNGPSPQTSPADAEFITRAYADSVYGPVAIRAALQISGSTPLFVTFLPGAGTGSLTPGTSNRIPKFTSPTTIGDSNAWNILSATGSSTKYNFEIGSTGVGGLSFDENPLFVQRDQNLSSDIICTNLTSDTAARAAFRAVAGGSLADIYMGATSDAYAAAGIIGGQTGFIFTGPNTIYGLAIQTTSGGIKFQPGGSNQVEIGISDSPPFANLNIGSTGSSSVNQPLLVVRSQLGSTDVVCANAASGTGARAAFRAVSGGSADIYLGVTSTLYGASGGVTNLNAFIVSNSAAVAGLVIQTGAGPIAFQVNGSTERARFTTTNGNLNIGDSANDAASQPLLVRRNQNASTDVIVINGTSGTAGRATFVCQAKSSGTDPILYLGVVSDTYAGGAGLTTSQGFIATQAGTTNGMVIQTIAGPLAFQVASAGAIVQQISTDYAYEFTAASTAAVGGSGTARLRNNSGTLQLSNNGGAYANIAAGGTVGGSGATNRIPKFTAATTLGDSIIWDVLSSTGASTFHNIEIGTSAASGLSFDSNPLYVERDLNGSADILIFNADNTSTGSARSAFRALAKGSSNPDIYMGVTSSNYATAGGVGALTGFFYTGANTSNGMTLQTAASAIRFQPAGTTTLVSIAASGFTMDVTGSLRVGSTAAFTAPATISGSGQQIILGVQRTDAGTSAIALYDNSGLRGYFAASSTEIGIFSVGGAGWSIYTDGLQISFNSAGAPTNPAATVYKMYVDTSDGNKLKVLGASGTITVIAVP